MNLVSALMCARELRRRKGGCDRRRVALGIKTHGKFWSDEVIARHDTLRAKCHAFGSDLGLTPEEFLEGFNASLVHWDVARCRDVLKSQKVTS